MNTDYAIEIANLSAMVGKDFKALTDISVRLPAGKIIGVIGPSGAGKTTLIRVLVGRQKIVSGTVKVLGEAAGSAALRGQISYMTQGLSVYGDLTVGENLTYFATMAGVIRSKTAAEIKAVLRQVDLTRQAGKLVNDLSGGQKQRVSLAVALLGNPKILFLDEPTVGLDPVLREQLWKLFNSLVSDGKTIILSSHVMDEAERCQDLLLIRDGTLLAHNTPRELCRQTKSASVEQSFIKLVEATS